MWKKDGNQLRRDIAALEGWGEIGRGDGEM